jgi:hypothetical protein
LSIKNEELKNTSSENIDVDSLLSYFRYFIRNIDNLWKESKLEQKKRLQDYIFPNGIFIENNILRTTLLNPVIVALEDYKDQVINNLSTMVAHRGLEPLF